MGHTNNFLTTDSLLKAIFSYITLLCEKVKSAMVLRTTLSQVLVGMAQINRNGEKTSKKH